MNEEVSKLVSIGKITTGNGEKISRLEPGTYCLHKSWGAGKVASWDLLGDRMMIDFEGKPGHAMKLEFAANSLEPLEEGHVMAKWLSDGDALRAFATEQPAEFCRLALSSFGGSMTLDDWDDMIKGRIIPEGKYRSWWDNAKKEMRKDRQFVVPSKRNAPLELRAADASPTDLLMEEFNAARDGKSKLKVLEMILKDLRAFEGREELLQKVVEDTNLAAKQSQRQTPLTTIELIIARDTLVKAVEGLEAGEGLQLADVLQAERGRMDDILRGMGTTRQRDIYQLFPHAFGEDWVPAAMELLQTSGARAIAELAKHLVEQNHGEKLNEYLLLGLQQRSLNSDLLAWICKERKRGSGAVFGPDIGSAVINSLERDHYEDKISKSGRLHDILLNDADLIADILENADRNQVRNFARRLLASPVFEQLNRGSLLARVIKLHPEVETIVTGDDDAAEEKREGLVVSWESLEGRKAMLENLVKKEIPENTKEISIARSYGDLRENFEFKAAKEMQTVLMRRQAELEAEIGAARATDFRGVDTTVVGIGTIVVLENIESGKRETFTVLGAWDTNLDKGIISYLSETGAALLGKAVGVEVEIGSEQEGKRHNVRVVEIRPYVTEPAEAKVGVEPGA